MKKLGIPVIILLSMLFLGCPPQGTLPIEQVEFAKWKSVEISLLNYTDEDIEVQLTYKDESIKTQRVAPIQTQIAKEEFITGDTKKERLWKWPSEGIPVSLLGSTSLGVYKPSFAENEYLTSLQVVQNGSTLYESNIHLDRAEKGFSYVIENEFYAGLPFDAEKLDSMYIFWVFDGEDGALLAEQISCYIGIFLAE